MIKRINNSQVKVESKNNNEGIILDKYEAVAFSNEGTLFKISTDRFILERNIQEYRDRNGQWKYWQDFNEPILAGIRKSHLKNRLNTRMRVRNERYEMTRQEACDWVMKQYIPDEFQADFQIAARPAALPVIAEIKMGSSESNTNDDESGLITLRTIYDEFICEKKFEDGIYELNGLRQLMKHHPSFRKEAMAMQKIFEGENVLNSLRTRTANL